MSSLDNYWPRSVAHLKTVYDSGVSDHVTIAEINEEPVNGYKGCGLVRTALVPLDLVEEVLKEPGGIGYEVESWGPHPCVGTDQIYDTSFWIRGRKNQKNERFQTLINSWCNNDQEVLLPDNVLLMAYGLVPRYLQNGSTRWDDPQGPVYDVLRVSSHVNHNGKRNSPLASISIRRDYLEDYCHLKGCAAVAVYYEERYSRDDETFATVLDGREGYQFELPGRLLGMATLNDEYHADAPQMSRVWGCRLILTPKSRPITDAADPELIWPGDTEPMTYQRAAANWSFFGYVRDEVLQEYEDKPEFQIYPESGDISYDSWWGTTRSYRIGRNHIQIELKKLYEGCPPHVIAHWHKYAVSEAIAKHDHNVHGNRNIATRAKNVVNSYMALTFSLERLADRLGIADTQEDFGVLTNEELFKQGWWFPEAIRPLYAVAPLNSTRQQFLERAVSLFKLLELLKPAPLKSLLRQLGISKDEIKDIGSLKLIACLCQLTKIAKEQRYSLFEDFDDIIHLRDKKHELPELCSLFALSGLRINQAHTPGKEREAKIQANATHMGIDVTETSSGWGYAIDKLYDRLATDLLDIAQLIEAAQNS